jgi:hypothetical protein
MPDVLLFELKVPQRIAYFFGGTGMLITVGVLLDTMRQLETFLLQRHYDGFLRKGRIRARSTAVASQSAKPPTWAPSRRSACRWLLSSWWASSPGSSAALFFKALLPGKCLPFP